MAKLKKFNIAGDEIGEIEMEDALLSHNGNTQLIKDCIVAYRYNQRQWSASTKTRSEVSCTGKKPRPQKGTGNARQGSYAATQYRGGGIAFGPKPKSNQQLRVNKKEKKLAFQTLLTHKIKEGNCIILEEPSMEKPKTQIIAQFMKKSEMPKRVMFVGNQEKKNFSKSVGNIPKCTFARMDQLNVYSLSLPGKIVLFENSVEQVKDLLKS